MFTLYGNLRFHSSRSKSNSHETLGIGYTLCEELIFDESYEHTRDSSISESEECCLLSISIEDFLSLGEEKGRSKGGGDGMQKDF